MIKFTVPFLSLLLLAGCQSAQPTRVAATPGFYPPTLNEGAPVEVILTSYGELRLLASRELSVRLPAHHEAWPSATTPGLMVPHYDPPSLVRYLVDREDGEVVRVYLLNSREQALDLMACAAECGVEPKRFLVRQDP